MKTHTLILSDLHLGAGTCDTAALLDFFGRLECKRIILAGDIFEKGTKLNEEEKKVLAYLLANKEKAVWIIGNHDPSLRSRFWKTLKVKPVKKFVWTAGAKKICVVHGDRFDRHCFAFDSHVTDGLFTAVVFLAERMRNTFILCVANWFFRKMHDKFARQVTRRVHRFATKHRYQTVIYGHTHKAIDEVIDATKRRPAVECINSGCCAAGLCFAVPVEENGDIELCPITLGDAPELKALA